MGWAKITKETSKELKETSREFTKKPTQNDPLDVVIVTLFWLTAAIFLSLIFFPAPSQYKILFFLFYFLFSIVFIIYKTKIIIKRYGGMKDLYQKILPVTRSRIYNKVPYLFAISLSVFFIIYYYVLTNQTSPLPVPDLSSLHLFEINLSTFITWVIVSTCLVMLCYRIPVLFLKDFNYYYAKRLLEHSVIRSDSPISEKINILKDVLKAYDKYIQRRTKFKISNINKICSKILEDPKLSIDKVLHDLTVSFQEDIGSELRIKAQLMNDGLTPLKTISSKLSNDWPYEILKKGSSGENIVLFARPLLPITGTLITFILSQMGIRFEDILKASLGIN